MGGGCGGIFGKRRQGRLCPGASRRDFLQRRKMRRAIGASAGLELAEPRLQAGQRPAQVFFLRAQPLQQFAILGSHASLTMSRPATRHKSGRRLQLVAADRRAAVRAGRSQ
jgi:hypothetical protein